jgi:hypothetical protein
MAKPPGLKAARRDFIDNIVSASNLFEAVVSFTKGKTYAFSSLVASLPI